MYEQSDKEFLAGCFNPEDANEQDIEVLSKEDYLALRSMALGTSAIKIIEKLTSKEISAEAWLSSCATAFSGSLSSEELAKAIEDYKSALDLEYSEYLSRTKKTAAENFEELLVKFPEIREAIAELAAEEEAQTKCN